MKNKLWSAILYASCILVLILDTKTAVNGANEGVILCIRSVIPSLFPLMFLTSMLISSLSGWTMQALRPFTKRCGIPNGAQALLVAALFGGYPVGAHNIAQMYREGSLDRNTAHRLLGFCSNAGPAFIFGITAQAFSSPLAGWTLWGIHILTALLVGMLLPGKGTGTTKLSPAEKLSTSSYLHLCVRNMAQICGWVVLFRVLISFLDCWFLWRLPEHLNVLICGALELTNGCSRLSDIPSEEIRFISASVMLAFGGVCVTMQTRSVTGELGMGMYLNGKLMQSLLSILFSILAVYGHLWIGILLAGMLIFCLELKNKAGNPIKIGV